MGNVWLITWRSFANRACYEYSICNHIVHVLIDNVTNCVSPLIICVCVCVCVCVCHTVYSNKLMLSVRTCSCQLPRKILRNESLVGVLL